MAEQTDQNLDNHVMVPTQAFVILGLGLVTLILGIVGLVKGNVQIVSVGLITGGLGVMGAMLTARIYCTSLQDRIIRTEMYLRLHNILDADLAAKSDALSRSQLIGLRFASDAELPGLVQKVLDEGITKGGDIKKLVTDWQGDYHRV